MQNLCGKCGRENLGGSRFCRYCGENLLTVQNPDQDQGYSPYGWKTDDLHPNREARTAVRPTMERLPSNTPAQFYQPQNAQLVANPYGHVPGNYRCPNCGTTYLPIIERRISTAGWITFALLLVFTFIFFWIGLLIKEDVSVCPVCRYRLNR